MRKPLFILTILVLAFGCRARKYETRTETSDSTKVITKIVRMPTYIYPPDTVEYDLPEGFERGEGEAEIIFLDEASSIELALLRDSLNKLSARVVTGPKVIELPPDTCVEVENTITRTVEVEKLKEVFRTPGWVKYILPLLILLAAFGGWTMYLLIKKSRN